MDESGKPQFNTPIAFIIFKRPESTKRVFEEIRKVRPAKLFLVADGWRDDEEREQCLAARRITELIDWPCEVQRNFSDENLGCKFRVASGITWVFEHVERAIFLEDDTLPHPTFFPFVAELLERFAYAERIMHISGSTVEMRNPSFRPDASYYFSRLPHIWGWGTWRRAWKHYDVKVEEWPRVNEEGFLKKTFQNRAERDYWHYRFSEVYRKRNSLEKTETWDTQWVFACLQKEGVAITPATNLVTNIGFGREGTHISDGKSERLANLPITPMEFPLRHPSDIEIDEDADAFTHRYVWGVNLTFRSRCISLLKFSTPRLYYFLRSMYRFL